MAIAISPRVGLTPWRHLTACAVVCMATLALVGVRLPGTAVANAPVFSFSTEPTSTQAGGHPDIVTQFRVGSLVTQPEVPCNCNGVKDIIVNTPAGLIGIPRGIPQCTAAEFATRTCSPDSQVGVSDVVIGAIDAGGTHYWQPIYNMVAGAGQLALLASPAPITPKVSIYTSVTSRTDSDYGLEFRSFGVPRILPVDTITQIFWGVPAASLHDPLRFPFDTFKSVGCINGDTNPLPSLIASKFPSEQCTGQEWPPLSANVPATPFLANPTVCTGPLPATIDTTSYDLGFAHRDALYPGATGCDQLAFNPSLSAKPTTEDAGSPSGLDIDLTVPQTLSPTTPSPSQIRATSVSLPPGFTINPNAADGKTACSDAEARFGTREQAQCPEFAKIGTLSVESSSLPAPLPGFIYLGEPLPGNRYRVFLVADGFSLHVKLAGTARPDPNTGQLTVSFRDLPQAPFQEFDLHVFGSERGLLATPTQCGTYPVHSTFTPWDNELPDQTSTQFFTIDSGPGGQPCPNGPRPFGPSLRAGVVDGTGGAHSPFSLALRRSDGEQNLTGLTVKTPPGFTATLKGIPYCSEAAIARLAVFGYSGLAEQASPVCPAASQVGTAVAGAGAGTHPLYVPGKVYLAGPYKGAPLSLVTVVPAVSGPYDLGTIAVRAALHVDQSTAQVTTVSDPLPQILEGIPLRTNFVQVNLDRPGFALNPTNCDSFAVNASVSGDEGALATPSAHFQVANCADLAFAPKLSLALKGGTRRTAHPALTSTLTAKPGEANIETAQVTLPHSEFLDNAHISAPCTRVQFAADRCPALSQVGVAKAVSPILDRPLEGAVYLRSSSNPLPDLVADLRGQFHVVLVGRVSSVNGRIRTTFDVVPDVPVSSFVLSLFGGKKGLLVNSENLCAAPRKAMVKLGGQNGKHADKNTTLATSCGKKAKRKRYRRAHSRAGGGR